MRRAPGIRLVAPDDLALRAAQGGISELYFDAYRYRPASAAIGERLAGKSMRQYIKSWITEWDMERLFGESANIAIRPNPTDYTQSEELEQASSAQDADDE